VTKLLGSKASHGRPPIANRMFCWNFVIAGPSRAMLRRYHSVRNNLIYFDFCEAMTLRQAVLGIEVTELVKPRISECASRGK